VWPIAPPLISVHPSREILCNPQKTLNDKAFAHVGDLHATVNWATDLS
jgi:hypothetical protein